MIEHKSEDVANGVRAYWRVEDPSYTLINTYQKPDRESVQVTTQNSTGIVDNKLFPMGDQVGIVLPIGKWQFSSSQDGKIYKDVTILSSVDLGGDKGPSQVVNLTIDGQKPFPPIWGRYTKVGTKTVSAAFQPAKILVQSSSSSAKPNKSSSSSSRLSSSSSSTQFKGQSC